jgi:hypothetical protein
MSLNPSFRKFDQYLVVPAILSAHAAIDDNLRKASQQKSATLESLKQWQRLLCLEV